MGGLPDNYYTNKMKKFNVSKKENGYKLTLNYTPLGIGLDHAQDVLDKAILDDMLEYVPLESGALRSDIVTINACERGRVFIYPPNSDYGHYQHEGIVYVDPVLNAAGFYIPGVGFRSRKGVKKEPSTRLLTYSQPTARQNWGRYAIDHHKNEWLEKVKKALRGEI